MAETSTPRNVSSEVRLEDYAPPPFLVDSIELDFDLAGDECLVTSALEVRRAPGTPDDAPLVLDGTALELVSAALGGRALSPSEYGLSEDALVIPASLLETGTEPTGAPVRSPTAGPRSA